MVAMALPEIEGVSVMKAVMVTLAGLGITSGAVYRPELEMVPTAALPPVMLFTCQVTLVSLVLLTVAVNCCCEPSCTLAVAGATVTVGVTGGVGLPPPQAERVRTTSAAAAARIALFITRPRCSQCFVLVLVLRAYIRTCEGLSVLRSLPQFGAARAVGWGDLSSEMKSKAPPSRQKQRSKDGAPEFADV